MRFLLGIAATILCAGFVQAQPLPLPPTLRIVSDIDKDKGQIQFVETATRNVVEERTVVENVNGIQVTKKFLVQVPVTVMTTIAIKVADSRIITPDGKKVPAEDLWKRLKKNTVVAVSADGNTPVAPFLRALNAETLVIITPPAKPDPVPPPPLLLPKMK